MAFHTRKSESKETDTAATEALHTVFTAIQTGSLKLSLTVITFYTNTLNYTTRDVIACLSHSTAKRLLIIMGEAPSCQKSFGVTVRRYCHWQFCMTLVYSASIFRNENGQFTISSVHEATSASSIETNILKCCLALEAVRLASQSEQHGKMWIKR